MIENSLRSIPPEATRLIVAFSGGLDSTVLLHLVSQHCTDIPLLAWHVNHQLQSAADAMETFCAQTADEFGITFRVDHLQLETEAGNLEARAREARYALFKANAMPGDCILTAHHQADQAETFLLNLLRGSGVRGLRGIASSSLLAPATLLRPLLKVSKQEIREYAEQKDLSWFDDPSNVDLNHNRNFLRHRVMSVLQERWPGADQQISDSCSWQIEAQQLLDDLGEIDLQQAKRSSEWGPALNIRTLSNLSLARCRNALRLWLSSLGLKTPPASRLQTLIEQLFGDGQAAEISMPDYRLRTYGGQLFIISTEPDTGVEERYLEFQQDETLVIPNTKFQWQRKAVLEQMGVIDKGQALAIGFRQAVLGKQASAQQLKSFFQGRRIPPWKRDQLPLLFIDGKLTGYLS